LKKSTTYKDAGVNIDAGNALVEALKPLIQKTRRPEVLTGIGGFASLFSINKLKYDEPVLVSCTDGVGTKLKLAQELQSFQGIGVDLVAMCVNDLLCTGAEPLFFLDYYACGRLDTGRALQVLSGIADACAAIQCALVGGETAEMPGVYQSDEIDLAGFAVGVVNRSEIIDGSSIALGNKVVGLMSSGIHSNGYSLVRKVVEESGLDLHRSYPRMQGPLGEVLLAPTRIYVNPLLKLKKQMPLLGIAHITGGGLLENLPRILPPTTRAVLDIRSWVRPPVFDLLQESGNIPEVEMRRVFNCGIGMTVVVAEANAQDLVDRLRGMGFDSAVIGTIVAKPDPTAESVVMS
jgi:phosphoribosylformylglycinamidine cyclo-ligase